MEYSITKENLQKILDYLTSRPWSEANPLVQVVVQCKPLPEISPEPIAPESGPVNG